MVFVEPIVGQRLRFDVDDGRNERGLQPRIVSVVARLIPWLQAFDDRGVESERGGEVAIVAFVAFRSGNLGGGIRL